MAELGQITQIIALNVVAQTEPVKELKKEVKQTNSEFEVLIKNNQDLINKQIDNVRLSKQNILLQLSELRRIISEIKKADIDLARERNTLNLNQNERLLKETKKNRESFETAADIGLLIGSRGRSGISGQQVIDFLLRVDISDEAKILFANLGLDNVKREQGNIKRDLELGLEAAPGAFMGIEKIPLTDERRKELLQQLKVLDAQVIEIEKRIVELKSNDLLKEDPLQFRVNALDKSNTNTLDIIKQIQDFKSDQQAELSLAKQDLEVFLKDYASFISRLLELGLTEEDIKTLGLDLGEQTIQQIKNLGIEPPIIDFEMRIEPESQKEIQDQLDNTTGKINQQSSSFNALGVEVAMVGGGFELVTNSQSEFAQKQQETNQKLAEGKDQLEGFAEETENASFVLDGLKGVLTDTANILENAFSDVIFSTLKGDFDALKDIWQGALDDMIRSFSNFVAEILSRPIKFLFDGNKGKDADGNTIPLTTSDKVAGGLAIGGAVLGGIASQIENDIGSSIVGSLGNIASFSAAGLTLGASIGAIGGPLGAGIGAAIGFLASLPSLISSIFGKKPKLDIDFDRITEFSEELGEDVKRAATVGELIDEELQDAIFRIDNKKSGVRKDEIFDTIQGILQAQVEELQAIIGKLPSELADQLNESLLNTAVDIETDGVGGDRLLEFDDSGKSIKKQLEAFLGGELQARFLFSIRDFFTGSFEALGALPGAAGNLVDGLFEEFTSIKGTGAGAREARTKVGQELLATFNTFVDAFNFVEGVAADTIGGAVNNIQNLSSDLGFEGVPSIEELRQSVKELTEAAEIDPETIQAHLDLAAAIREAQFAILNSISSIIGSISSLNNTITSLGGESFDLTGFLNDGIDSVLGLLDQEDLSIEDQEALLGLGTGFLNQLIAEEQAAFQAQLQAAQQAAEAAAEAQRSAIRSQISGLEEERDLINENFDARIEALEEELRLAEEFARLTESIQQTLDSIILGPDSVFTAVERLNIVQGDIASLQSELAATTDPSRQLELAGQLEDSLSTLFDLAGEAFGVNSPEFTAIFSQVTGGLNDLLDLTGNRERSVEEINAEIEALNIERNEQLEAIDAQIANLNEQLSSIQAQNVEATFQASDRVQELAEFFRNEYITLLEERFAQLAEVSDEGFTEELDALNSLDLNISELKDAALQSIELEDSMLVELRDMNQTFKQAFGNLEGFRNGTGGFVDFGRGTLAVLHGREAVIPESQFTPFSQFQEAAGEMNVNINVNVDGGSSGTVETLATNIEDMLVRSIRQGGKLRSAVQEAGARRLN